MVLRDMSCDVCGRISCDVMLDSLEQVSWLGRCKECERETCHSSVVNGGTRKRYRFHDWPDDPEFYRGQVRAGAVEAVDSNGDAVRRYHSGTREFGEAMHDAPRYEIGGDIRSGKVDELTHATRRKRGTLPIVCDLGSRS